MTIPTPGQPGPDQPGVQASGPQPEYGQQPGYSPAPGYGPQPAYNQYPGPPPHGTYSSPGYGFHPGYGPPKNHIVAVVLSILLGGFGVDRFYLGHIGLGVAKLLLSWLTFGVWWLIDVILIAAKATDGLKQINWER